MENIAVDVPPAMQDAQQNEDVVRPRVVINQDVRRDDGDAGAPTKGWSWSARLRYIDQTFERPAKAKTIIFSNRPTGFPFKVSEDICGIGFGIGRNDQTRHQERGN